MSFKHIFAALMVSCSLYTFTACAQVEVHEPTGGNPEWSKDYEPFQIAGNLYYVGSYDLGMYLIATSKGHILINTGLASSAEMIQRHVEKLGYKMSDIKILLTNQAHFDHMGGMAAIKKQTGATLMVMDGDVQVAESGGRSDYIMGKHGVTFAPVKVNRVLHDGDKIKLGGFKLKVLKHSGHTQGSCSYLLYNHEGKREYVILIANMPKMLPDVEPAGMEGYPDVAKDFEYTYNAMPKLQFDLWVAAHASQFRLHDKHKPGDKYNPEVFRDREGYLDVIKNLQQEYLDKKNKK
jgi:metallo-beta-lactamase class B